MRGTLADAGGSLIDRAREGRRARTCNCRSVRSCGVWVSRGDALPPSNPSTPKTTSWGGSVAVVTTSDDSSALRARANGGAPPGSVTVVSSDEASASLFPGSHRRQRPASQPHRSVPLPPMKSAPNRLEIASSEASARKPRFPGPVWTLQLHTSFSASSTRRPRKRTKSTSSACCGAQQRRRSGHGVR